MPARQTRRWRDVGPILIVPPALASFASAPTSPFAVVPFSLVPSARTAATTPTVPEPRFAEQPGENSTPAWLAAWIGPALWMQTVDPAMCAAKMPFFLLGGLAPTDWPARLRAQRAPIARPRARAKAMATAECARVPNVLLIFRAAMARAPSRVARAMASVRVAIAYLEPAPARWASVGSCAFSKKQGEQALSRSHCAAASL